MGWIGVGNFGLRLRSGGDFIMVLEIRIDFQCFSLFLIIINIYYSYYIPTQTENNNIASISYLNTSTSTHRNFDMIDLIRSIYYIVDILVFI